MVAKLRGNGNLHLLDAESLLSHLFADSQAIIEFRQKLASEINKLQHAVAEGQCWQSDWRITESEAMAARERTGEIRQTLLQLGQMDRYAANARRQTAIMVADAFTNPDYMRYAVKTLLACLICYTFYSGVDWEGIHTCTPTCVIVANPNVGSSYQKMVLRFGGAFCGAIRRCYSRYWSCPGWTILSNCCLCWHPFSCWAHGSPPALNALLYRHTDGGHLRARHARKRFWPGAPPGGNSRSRPGSAIRSVVSAVIYTFVGLKAKRARAGSGWHAGVPRKVMRIPRQQEVTACALICKFVSVCMRRLMPVKRCANAWRWSVNWTAKNAPY